MSWGKKKELARVISQESIDEQETELAKLKDSVVAKPSTFQQHKEDNMRKVAKIVAVEEIGTNLYKYILIANGKLGDISEEFPID